MAVEIGKQYEETRRRLERLIPDGLLEWQESSVERAVCYFCCDMIVNSGVLLRFEEENGILSLYLHQRCYDRCITR
jgi:hypothetical protein